MSNLHDTFMNIVVFAFIGLLIWLYFKPFDQDENDDSNKPGNRFSRFSLDFHPAGGGGLILG